MGTGTPPLESPAVSWRPTSIDAQVGPVNGAGQFLILTQALEEHETGWTFTAIELPFGWKISSAKVLGEDVVIVRTSGETYRLGARNLDALEFAILDDGEKTDAELESLWATHAGPGDPPP